MTIGATVRRKAAIGFRHIRWMAKQAWINHGIRRRVDRRYAGRLPAVCGDPRGVLLADGAWDNPNFFFRLMLTLDAVDPERRLRRVAVVRESGSAPQRRTLSALGFSEFIVLPDSPPSQFVDRARAIMDGVSTHQEFLDLDLPGGLPAFIIYDAVLKRVRDPQPALDHPQWIRSTAEALAVMDRIESFLATADVRYAFLSHPWNVPYGAAAWTVACRGIHTVHLTAYAEGIRMRRLDGADGFVVPAEHLRFKDYERMPSAVRQVLIDTGMEEFERRLTGTSTDINCRYAFHPDSREADGQRLRRQLIGDDTRPVVLICAHVWFDFPHTYAMRNFTDFLDWMAFTLDHIREIDDVVWLLKPHPMDTWHGGFQLSEIAPVDLPHVINLPCSFDQATALSMCDAVVTVHGTAGLEAGILGLPVLCADRSYYSDWPFAVTANTRAEYGTLLAEIGHYDRTGADARAAAAACFAAAWGQPNSVDGRLKIRCDSLTSDLYDDILALLGQDERLRAESQRIRRWLASDSGSYAVHCLLEPLRTADVGGEEPVLGCVSS